MTTHNNSTRPNKTLIVFAVVYTAITVYFILDIKRDESASLGYVFLFPAFWVLGGIVLGLLFWLKKIKIKTTLDRITLALSTPVPLFVLVLIWSALPYSESPASTYEYSKNGRRHRRVEYQYRNGQTKRVEYYISRDSVTEANPFPENDIWLNDSIWTYYKKDGTIEREENY